MTNPWTVASIPRFFFTRSAILRRQPSPCSGVATMSAAGEKNFSSDAAHLETIFKQKKALRSVVKRDLKSMDPILRSQEGIFFFQHTNLKVDYFSPLWRYINNFDLYASG